MRRLSPAVVLLAAACGGAISADPDNQDLAPAALTATPQGNLQHEIPLNGTSTLSFRTLANAQCAVRRGDQPVADADAVRVFADDDGIGRLVLTDTEGKEQTARLALDCADDSGRSFTHVIVVRASANARAQAPAPYNRAGKKKLPKLDVDPASLTPADIAARGYPPRPGADSPQYPRWLALVSSEATVIAPHIAADARRSHGPANSAALTSNASGNSNNWSGYVIATPATSPIFAWIFADWQVPRVYPRSGFWNSTYSSFWVGIDGWGSADVVQAGTDSNTGTYFWVQTTSYDAWTEWYPLSSKTVSNFPVNPGDKVDTWVWVTDANGNYSSNVTRGNFYLWNESQNVATGYLSTGIPSGTVFNGHQAEWVLERPTVGGSLSTLSNYSYARLAGASAYDLWGGHHTYGSDYSVNITMTGSSGVLSTVTPIDSGTMDFYWHNYN